MERDGNFRRLLVEYENIRITDGMSGAEVYHLPGLNAYLKIAPRPGFSDLLNEKKALDWLRGKLPVPDVLGYEETADADLLLTSAIAGVPASGLLSNHGATIESEIDIAVQAARMLRRMHDIPIDGCELDQRLDAKFRRAWKNITHKLLSETDEEFATTHNGNLPVDVYHELSAKRPTSFDLVFSHGDPCMPNMIFRDRKLVGLIDLDGGGIADRYTDISIFFRSFEYNCRVKVDLEETFLEAYGLDEIDRDKFEFYLRLDDLF